jgi:hypothetical protein
MARSRTAARSVEPPRRSYSSAVLDDGTYDAMVLDAAENGDGTMAMQLTVLGGPHKGEVVAVKVSGLARDALDLLAVPATLTVSEGEPSVALEG